MKQIVFELSSWLSLLGRFSLLLQLAVLAGLFVLSRLLFRHQRISPNSWRIVFSELAFLASLGLAYLVLQLVGMPAGLVLLAAELLAIWIGLEILRLLLRRYNDPLVVESYFQRAVRPLFFVLGLMACLGKIDNLESFGNIPLMRLFDQNFTIGDLGLLLTLPYFVVVLSELPSFLFGSTAARLMGMTPGNRKALELIIRYLLIGLGLVWMSSFVGLNGNAVAAMAGGLSVGLGFGIKEVFSNFVSGLWLLLEGSVRPGEILIVDGDACEVKNLGLRASTLLRTSDNAELVVPNQTFFTNTTTTFTGETKALRCSSVTVGADYKHEPDEVIALLVATAKANPRVLSVPPPKAFVANFGESAIDYELEFSMADPLTKGSIAKELRRAIWYAFRDNGIEMPYPQQVLHWASRPRPSDAQERGSH
jgi:small-conductance mechanosensitive channel